MKHFNPFLLMILLAVSSSAQDNITGKTSKDEILKSAHSSWFTDGYRSYNPKPKTIEELKHIFEKNEFQVNVYFGTWCSDSQREVPKLIKLLEKSQFNLKNLNLVGVDRDKVIPDISEEKQEELNVFNVPTIIVYEDGKEINRFVEYARESLERDLLKIFSKTPYKNSYHK